MQIPIMNKTIIIGKNALRMFGIFMAAILMMTGHYFTVTAGNHAGDIQLMVDGAGANALQNGDQKEQMDPGQQNGGVYQADGSAAGEGASGSDALGYDTKENDAAGSSFGKTMNPSESDEESGRIYIYVTGAVKNPGVYEMERSSMIVDAVDMAGGFTEQADSENVNMVYKLEQNAMLNIKRKPQAQLAEQLTGNTDNGGGNTTGSEKAGSAEQTEFGEGAQISLDYDGVLANEEPSKREQKEQGNRLVNINTADKQELTTLPGIGDAMADRILAYREEHKKFHSIEDLMNISGIKQAKFDGLKDFVTV